MWGPIGDTGYLARETRVSDMLARTMGAPHMQAVQALEELPALLQSGRSVVGLSTVNWDHIRQQLPNLIAPFWSELPMGVGGDPSGHSIRQQIAERTAAEATAIILQVLIEEIAAILKQPPASIEPDRAIVEFGVDSLMAVELQMALEHRLGVKQQAFALAMTSTLRGIAARMLQSMRTDGPETGEIGIGESDLDATFLRHEGDSGKMNVFAYRQPALVGSPDAHDTGRRPVARRS
jgi:acyl carrier protein